MVTLRKRLKAKKRREKYEKKRNVMKNNVPKAKRFFLREGDGILPKTKKENLSKKEIERRKKADSNFIKTASGS